ncbi:hypothetical protein E3983_09675 [Legionella israelensis]|uniref:Uncharacterized protein n=1 Tax=Legionella israelensis TaxID=454 RepID=A0AAX1EHL8_9GAMM|nr:hypothetical protein [Legionella israelensis]QBR84610.1 hypothetical protein E3983_09675 [Legionella israelensis]QDP72269.1 hypothetical protein FOG18_06720 [Legionella israelensis]
MARKLAIKRQDKFSLVLYGITASLKLFYLFLNHLFISIFLLLSSLSLHAEPYLAPKHARAEKKNVAGVFIGGLRSDGRNFFSYGMEYHRIISFPFAVAFMAEDVPNNKNSQHEYEIISSMIWHLPHNFLVGFGPGIKFEKGEPDRGLARFEIGYIFLPAQSIEILPNVNFDIVEGGSREWSYGITFGKQF